MAQKSEKPIPILFMDGIFSPRSNILYCQWLLNVCHVRLIWMLDGGPDVAGKMLQSFILHREDIVWVIIKFGL